MNTFQVKYEVTRLSFELQGPIPVILSDVARYGVYSLGSNSTDLAL